jgi:hypothetical protein
MPDQVGVLRPPGARRARLLRTATRPVRDLLAALPAAADPDRPGFTAAWTRRSQRSSTISARPGADLAALAAVLASRAAP